MSGLGSRRRAIGKLWGGWRAVWKRSQISMQKPFEYELQQAKDVSNGGTLTNHFILRHLQNRISGFPQTSHFLGFKGIV